MTYDATIKLVSMAEKENHTLVIMSSSNFLILDSHIISPGQGLVSRKKTLGVFMQYFFHL